MPVGMMPMTREIIDNVIAEAFRAPLFIGCNIIKFSYITEILH